MGLEAEMPHYELDDAIAGLYLAFPLGLPAGSGQGCPCCVRGEEAACIERTPREQLSGSDLTRYAFKAMTTWGTEAAYRYFLPRILEICARDPRAGELPGFAPGVIARKLEYGDWTTWPEVERCAVNEFARAWWVSSEHQDPFAWVEWVEEFVEPVLGEMTPQLQSLIEDPSDEALGRILHLAEFGGRSVDTRIGRWLRSAGLSTDLEARFSQADDEATTRRLAEALERLERLRGR